MNLPSWFFLPVVRPPKKVWNDALGYYAGLEAAGVKVSVNSPGSFGQLEITVEKSDQLHGDPEDPRPVSTVFALTSGFISYHSGEVLLRVWTADYEDLSKGPGGARPNRIVLGGLDEASLKLEIAAQIAKLNFAILWESWKQGGGTGVPPAQSGLQDALLDRFMKGDAEIFVSSGTPLAEASAVAGATVRTVRLTLQAFFDAAGPAPPVPVPPEDLIDNAIGVLHPRFFGHPLIKATNSLIPIRFRSRFLIWDNTVFNYRPLVDTDVTLVAGPDITIVPVVGEALETDITTARTNNQGYITVLEPVLLPARAMIRFRYHTTNTTYGTRLYTEDVKTDPHKARLYLNALGENWKEYKAKWELRPHYRDFINDLADHEDDEFLGKDRGTARKAEKIEVLPLNDLLQDLTTVVEDVLPSFSQRDYIKQIGRFESCYKADVPPARTFNVLFEGDSWLNYPLAYNDIYGHLDKIFWAKKQPDVTYNRLPLQHFGDRTDQMFQINPAQGKRQWDFTTDVLSEYKIDLIICSGGGNDFVEPGISNRLIAKDIFGVDINKSASAAPYKTCFGPNGYFDPFLMAGKLDAGQIAVAERLMDLSFASLLKNHLWYIYLKQGSPSTQKSTAQMSMTLDPLLTVLAKYFGPATLQSVSLQEIGENVIANVPERTQLPVSTGDAYDQLLTAVFDDQRYSARFLSVRTYWETILLPHARTLGIPVITHSYCYPLFNEDPTSYFGQGKTNITGPWFTPRFFEANIADRRIHKIGLKTLIDNFMGYVLQPLKGLFPDIFDYVDVRNLNSSTDSWRDEMHLHAPGFKKIAEQIYVAVKNNSRLAQFFES